jgi:hypothetical protein
MNITEAQLLSTPDALSTLLIYHVPDLTKVPSVPVVLMNKTLHVSTYVTRSPFARVTIMLQCLPPVAGQQQSNLTKGVPGGRHLTRVAVPYTQLQQQHLYCWRLQQGKDPGRRIRRQEQRSEELAGVARCQTIQLAAARLSTVLAPSPV